MSVELSVDNLSCIRQDRCLFEQLSFSLKSGDIMQVAGPNGAGKSSLLRILAGFLTPHSGQVCYQGQTVDKQRLEFNDDLLFIGHKAGVNGHLSAFENLQYWVDTHGCVDEHDPYTLLGRLGLVGLEDVAVSQLSAGQQRKVALARLWLSKARIWILDEPFTAIDASGVKGLQRRFEQFLASGGMIVLTTHQDLTMNFPSLQQLRLEYRF